MFSFRLRGKGSLIRGAQNFRRFPEGVENYGLPRSVENILDIFGSKGVRKISDASHGGREKIQTVNYFGFSMGQIVCSEK